jgi:hypothetical protein
VVDIAVIHTSDEVSEAIEWALRSAGWSTERASPLDFKRGRLQFTEFLKEYDPLVLVWDIAVPFEENWTYYQTVRQDPAVRDRRFVATTSNARALRKLVGKVQVFEFLATPPDLDDLCTAVRSIWPAP